MHRLKFLIIFFIIILLTELKAQINQDSIIVDISSKSITVEEFIKRFELTPWALRNYKTNSLEAKTDFLISLIAEKLLSLKAESINIDTIFIVRNSLLNLEKMLIRDALYHKEILSKVKYDKKELDFAIQRSLSVNYIKFIESRDSIEIFNIYNSIKKADQFDSILVKRPEYNLQLEPVGISFGTMPPELEDVVYTTKSGSYSKPIFSNGKFYIIKIDSVINLIENTDLKLQNIFEMAEKKLKERKEKNLFRDFFIKFFADKKGKIEENTFINVIGVIQEIIAQKQLQNPETKKITFDYDDLLQAEQKLSVSLNKPLFYADTTKIITRDFLHRLVADEITFQDTLLNSVMRKLQVKIKSYIADEFLSNEGYRQNLHNSEAVKNDIKIWKDSYYSNAYNLLIRNRIKIDPTEIDSFYSAKNENIQSVNIYKVQEILVDSLEMVEYLLNKLKTEAFGNLARKFSKRKWAAENDGNLGFITEGMFGEIGRVVSSMQINEIYAPIKTDSGYSIIKLLEKTEKSPIENYSNEEQKKRIKEFLFQKKYNSERDKEVVELAQKYIKKIDFKLLQKLETTDINFIVFRYYGFGGKTTAVPLLIRYNSWFDKWKELQEQNP